MTTLEQAVATREALRTKLATAQQGLVDLDARRQELAFEAHSAGGDAKRELDKLNKSRATYLAEIETIESAITEASRRVAEAKRAEAAKAEALKGAQALEIANRLKEHAEKLDLALVTIAAASMAYERDVRELNVQLHCTHPNAAQLQSLGVRAVKAGLMLSAFQIEHLAPSERHTFAELTTQWTALIERWAEARLPQSEAAE